MNTNRRKTLVIGAAALTGPFFIGAAPMTRVLRRFVFILLPFQ